MFDFLPRPSDAFNRQRQGSADSIAPSSPDAAKSPEEPLKQRTGSSISESHVNEAYAGTATSMYPMYLLLLSLSCDIYTLTAMIGDGAQPKRYPWGWKHQQGDASKKGPGLKDDFDWIVAS